MPIRQHSTTLTSSQTSSQGASRDVGEEIVCDGRVDKDPLEDFGKDLGVVECGQAASGR